MHQGGRCTAGGALQQAGLKRVERLVLLQPHVRRMHGNDNVSGLSTYNLEHEVLVCSVRVTLKPPMHHSGPFILRRGVASNFA